MFFSHQLSAILNQQKLTIIKRLHVKLHKITVLILLFIAQLSMSMETTSSWQTLPIEIILHIAALTDNKATIALVNQQLCFFITQKNMLKHYPQGLSSQDHMNFMVKNAKKNDIAMIKLGLKTASLCGHDYLHMLSFVITKGSSLLGTIDTYKNNPHTEFPEELIDPIISLLKGDINCINEYKKQLPLVNPNNISLLTPLHVAVNNGHLAFAQLFLAQDPTLLNKRPCRDHVPLNYNGPQLIMATPLEVAIYKNYLPLCKYLLSFKNIKLDSVVDNYTLLNWTVQHGTLETMKLVTNRLKQKYSQAHYNALFSDQTLILAIQNKDKRLFLLHEMNYTLPGKRQPLHIAISYNQIDLAKHICDHKNTNINAQDENGNTPLMFAAQRNNIEIIKLLLHHNADPDIKNLENKTAYDYTSSTEIKKLLTKKNELY